MLSRSIKQLKPGEKITEFFIIRKKEIRTKKTDNEPYLALELGLPTGRISATIWQEVEEQNEIYHIGDIVKIKGRIIDYKGKTSLVIEKMKALCDEDHLIPADFLPGPKKELDQLRGEFNKIIQSIRNKYLEELLARMFSEKDTRHLFEQIPAGKLWHHNRLAGLFEHTISMVQICDFLSSHYPTINRDIIITATILHDIGKIKSYVIDRGFIEYTDEGRLVGHVALGASSVERIIADIPEFPGELRKQILHLILSHHGELAHGAPVVPMTLEAIVLYMVDQLDSKVDAFLRIAESEQEEGKKWSNYVKLMDRFFYFPDSDKQ